MIHDHPEGIMTGDNPILRSARLGAVIAAATLFAAGPALAGHGGGGGNGGGHGGPGGNSANHMSAQGMANTNGPNAANRAYGTDRASQRASAQGLAHGKGLSKTHHSNGHHKSSG
jgi:hypothetical protein